LQPQRFDSLAEGKPKDPVGKAATNFLIVGQINGEHCLADAAHAVQPDRGYCSGNADSSTGGPEHCLLQSIEIFLSA